LDVFYFQHTDQSNGVMEIIKTDLNLS